MTKQDIIRNIAEELDVSQVVVRQIVGKVFESIVDTVASEGRIELRNFGVFEVKKRAARVARNPKTGEEVRVPERRGVAFKAGKEMAARISHSSNEDAGVEETARASGKPIANTGSVFPNVQNISVQQPPLMGESS